MSKDLNLCQFIGRLGNDPEIRYSNDGKAIANLSMACGDDYKDKQGNKVEKTNWIRVAAFGRLAEIMGEYLKKGSQIYVSGKFVVRKWQDQSGADKYTTEIVASELQMLDSRGDNSGQQRQQAPAQSQQGGGFDSDAPF